MMQMQPQPCSSTTSTPPPTRIRCCAVCSDSPAKIHYGVLACFGCKGFFRRAVKDGRNKYVCRYDKQCAVNKYERNSCRYCRFRKCLQVGMNPDAVRPDRDDGLKNKNGKRFEKMLLSKKKSLSRTSSRPPDDVEDWTRFLAAEQRTLLMQLIKLESEIQNANEQTYESVADFNLKSLVADRMLASKYSNSSRAPLPNDPFFTAMWRVVSVVDWVDGVVRLTEQNINRPELTVEDKTALIQSSFSSLTLYSVAAKAAADSQNDFTNIQSTIEPCARQFARDVARRSFSELVLPLRQIAPSDVEYVLLKTILVLNPDAPGLCNTGSSSLRSKRDLIQELLFKAIKKSRPKSTTQPASHFGNLLLLIPSLRHLGNEISGYFGERYVRGAPPMAHFQKILTDIFNPEYDDLLLARDLERSDVEQSENQQYQPQKHVVFSVPQNPPISCSLSFSPCFFSPPPPPPQISDLPRPCPIGPTSQSHTNRPATLDFTPKLPLQLTRSIEEMLRPAGMADDPSINRPLTSDWADTVGYSTPVFNRDVVSQFFPEIIGQMNNQ